MKYIVVIALLAAMPALAAACLAPDGAHFFYSNPLMRRSNIAEILEGNATTSRVAWPAIACCPPNLMRFLATLPDLAVTADSSGLQVHQYVPGAFSAEIDGGSIEIAVPREHPNRCKGKRRCLLRVDELSEHNAEGRPRSK